MTHSVGWTFSQNFSSLALPVWDWECLEDILTLKNHFNHFNTELMNDRGDCRTAPATPGLLDIYMYSKDTHVIMEPLLAQEIPCLNFIN